MYFDKMNRRMYSAFRSRKTREIFILLSFFLLCSPTSAGEEAAFIPGTEDVPLLEKIDLLPSEETIFDTPGSAVSVTYAQTPRVFEDILASYADALSGLGWEQRKSGYFERDEQIFSIEKVKASESSDGLIIVFKVISGGRSLNDT